MINVLGLKIVKILGVGEVRTVRKRIHYACGGIAFLNNFVFNIVELLGSLV